MNLASTLGRTFLVAGAIPALLLVLVNRFVIGPRLPTWVEQLPALPELGIDGAWEGVAIFVIAALLLSLNTILIQLYEGVHPLTKGLLGRWQRDNESRHEKRFGRLSKLRQAIPKVPPHRQRDLQVNLFKEHSRILAETAENPLTVLPFDRQRIKPTALGNAWAGIEEYGTQRYGLDGRLFWPRLVTLIPDRLAGLISNNKMNADFWLNLSAVSVVLGAEALVLGLLWNMWGTVQLIFRGDGGSLVVGIGLLGLALLAFGGAWAAYRGAVVATVDLGLLMNAAFDLHRHELHEAFRLPEVENLSTARAQWESFGNFLLSGESFFYPERPAQYTADQLLGEAPPVSGPELLHSLRDLHRRRLALLFALEGRAANYNPNDVPYDLTVGIEEASTKVRAVEQRLRALEAELSQPLQASG